MTLNLRNFFTSLALCALLGSSAANAATVLKLSLAGTGSDIEMVQSGSDFFIGTGNDLNGSTTGDQNTAIDYTGFLSGETDITTNIASFSLAGLKRTGAPTIQGGLVVLQDFFGGTFNLYDPSNVLLLSGNLQDSLLSGVISNNGTGSIFTTKVGNFTSGTLVNRVVPNSLNVTIGLTNVAHTGGTGFLVTGAPFALQPFTADASVSISADEAPVPEPSSIVIALLAATGFSLAGRRRS